LAAERLDEVMAPPMLDRVELDSSRDFRSRGANAVGRRPWVCRVFFCASWLARLRLSFAGVRPRSYDRHTLATGPAHLLLKELLAPCGGVERVRTRHRFFTVD